MTDRNIELTRRKILASVGAVGAAGAGAGLGTSALFSDEESFTNNSITAGTLDLLVDYYAYWDQGMAGSGSLSGIKNGDGTVSAELTDVKPGDNGLVALCPRIEDNPAYLWLCGSLTANDENSVTEPEADADPDNNTVDTDAQIAGQGELAQNINLEVSYCDLDRIGDNGGFEPSDVASSTEIWTGTLADFLATIGNGVPLDGDGTGGGFLTPGEQACFAGTGDDAAANPCLCIAWNVPVDVGNEIQSDSVEFDLTLYAEQCRNNDGTNNPCCSCGPDEYAVNVPGGGTTCVTEFSGSESVEDFYDHRGSPYYSFNDDIQTADTTNVFVYHDTSQDTRSLVIIHDDRDDDDGGVVSMDLAFDNDGSYDWQVKDDNPDSPDQYSTSSDAATADWTWAGGKTDGGAVGTLAADFGVDLTARFNDSADINRSFGSGDITTWQVIQPSDDPVVLASDIGPREGDLMARLFQCGE